jgi:hypothetical protein
MSDQTKLEQFIASCRGSPITVEFLETNQLQYDFLENSILECICSNPDLTPQVLQWLLSNYPNSISDNHLEHILRNLDQNRQIFPMEEYIILIDHIIKIKGNLYNIFFQCKISGSDTNILHWIFAKRSFDAPMLNYLYQMDPQLDIWCEDSYERSPLFFAINNSYRLLELLQVIKSYEPAQSRTKIRTKYTEKNRNQSFVNLINRYAQDSDQSTICALIGLCGELFPLIKIKYLTQDICNQFYSSKYFCWSQDKESLIKLIPEQFPRKPCRLWRNQFAGCEFSWTKNKTCFPSPIRT